MTANTPSLSFRRSWQGDPENPDSQARAMTAWQGFTVGCFVGAVMMAALLLLPPWGRR
jgi:hypothetical protein